MFVTGYGHFNTHALHRAAQIPDTERDDSARNESWDRAKQKFSGTAVWQAAG